MKEEESMTMEENKQVKEMVTFLEKLGFSKQNCALAEKYLSGKFGDAVLDQFERIEFSTISRDVRNQAKDFMRKLNRETKDETAIRLFRILYVAGHNTCAEVLCNCTHSIFDVKEIELYQRMAIYIHHYTKNTYFASLATSAQWNHLVKMADNNPEQIKESIALLEGEGQEYILAALTLYFNMKYQNSNQIAEEDVALMELYENTLLDWLDICVVRKECTKRMELRDAIRNGQLTKELIYYMKTQSMSKSELQHFIAVCRMAYLNFPRSSTLKNIVKSCMSIYTIAALFALENTYIGEYKTPANIKIEGADYDELFSIDPKTYICWAAMTNSSKILKRQLEKHQELYVEALQEKTFEMPILLYRKVGGIFDLETMWAVNVLMNVMREVNPQLYQQVASSIKPNYDHMILKLLSNSPHVDLAKKYLRGDCAVSALYPYDKEYANGQQYAYRIQDKLYEYYKRCNDMDFIKRCKVFLVLASCPYLKIENGTTIGGIKRFFAELNEQQLDIAHQLSGFGVFYKANQFYSGCSRSTLIEGAEQVFADYLCTKREETLAAFLQAGVEGRYLALRVMRKNPNENRKEILDYAVDSAKLVREELLNILYIQTDWEDDIKTLLQSKKAVSREIAVQVLSHWQKNGKDFNNVLLQAMEKEKNAKVMTLLQSALSIEENFVNKPLSKQELVKQMHKGNRKRTLAWAYATPFSMVHGTDGGEISEEYLQAILLCYALQDKCGISKNAKVLAEDLNVVAFARYVNELFDKWLATGAESKKRWVLYAASIHGGEEIIQKLQYQLKEWPLMGRGVIAAEAVKALALNPSPRALLLVEAMARKFKYKQVKVAAGEAFAFAATELGITREELSDRIVPDLGFDANMGRIFDYGTRKFKVMLTSTLDIEVYDENGKKLKNLPAPGKKDDQEKAVAAYETFKQLKKQLKATISSQKARLEYALFMRREWTVDAWINLFVKNPVMHQFAIGLIWGVYEGNNLIQSFRYMEDGSFNTPDEDEYTLPEGAKISLVHPIELSDEEKATWKEQLVDYEITQPIEQIDRKVYYVTEEERKQKSMERFGGCIVNDLSLNGKLTGFGWYHGSVQDGGGFFVYYREDTETDMAVELHFSGTYIAGLDENVTIYDARFYKPGTIEHGSYTYDEVDKDKAYFLNDIPPRYFSEILLQIAQTVALSKEYNFNWKKEITTL